MSSQDIAQEITRQVMVLSELTDTAQIINNADGYRSFRLLVEGEVVLVASNMNAHNWHKQHIIKAWAEEEARKRECLVVSTYGRHLYTTSLTRFKDDIEATADTYDCGDLHSPALAALGALKKLLENDPSPHLYF